MGYEFECERCSDPATTWAVIDQKHAGNWERYEVGLCNYCLRTIRTQESLFGDVNIIEIERLPRVKYYANK